MAWIDLGEPSGETAHCGRKLTIRAAGLLKYEIDQVRIGRTDTHGAHETLVVHEYGSVVSRCWSSARAKLAWEPMVAEGYHHKDVVIRNFGTWLR